MHQICESGKRNVIGIVVDSEIKAGAIQVSRESNGLKWWKTEVNKKVANAVCANPPQVGFDAEQKNSCWRLLGEVMM